MRSSPAWWPSWSLIAFSPSRSSMTSASGMPVRPTRWSSRARSSWKARWLRRPVSGSVTAICASRASSWRRKRRRMKAKQPSSTRPAPKATAIACAAPSCWSRRRALCSSASAERGPRLQVDAVLELPEDRVDHLVVELHGQLRVVRVDGREQPPRRLVVAPVELEQPADRLARLHRGVEQRAPSAGPRPGGAWPSRGCRGPSWTPRSGSGARPTWPRSPSGGHRRRWCSAGRRCRRAWTRRRLGAA